MNGSPKTFSKKSRATLAQESGHAAKATERASAVFKETPRTVALYYWLFGIAWILLSDLSMVHLDLASLGGLLISSSKGVLFVTVSALLIYWLLRKYLKDLYQATMLSRIVLESTSDPIYVKDREGRYLMLNSAALAMTGCALEECLGKTDGELYTSEIADKFSKLDDVVIATGEPVISEQEILWGREVKTLHCTRVPLSEVDGETTGVICVTRDISNRKKAELQLLEERNRFETLVETVPVIICSFHRGNDGRGGFLYASPAIERFVGVEPSELADDGSLVFSLVHPQDRDHVIELLNDSEAHMSLFQVQCRFNSPVLGEIWLEAFHNPVRQADGRIVWHGYFADITERQKSHAALAEVRQRLEDSQHVARLGSWSWSPAEGKVWWSDTVYELWGLKPGEVDPSISEIEKRLSAKGREEKRQSLEAIQSGHNRFEHEFEIDVPGQGVRWIYSVAKVVRDEAENVLRIDGIDQDVTVRKLAELELRRSQERLQSALEGASGGVWEWQVDTGQSWWSTEMYNLWGLPLGSDVSYESVIGLVHAEDRPLIEKAGKEAVESSSEYQVEFRITHAKLGERWMLSRGRLSSEPSGSRILGITIDVTSHHRVEQSLLESQTRFRNLVQLLPDAVVVAANGYVTFSNDAFARLVDVGAADGERELLLSDILPDESVAKNLLKQVDLAQSVVHFETFLTGRRGARVPVRLSAAKVLDQQLEAVLIVMHDLTDQRQSEDKIREQEILLRDAAEIARVGGWSLDPKIRKIHWTPETAQIHEVEEPDGIGLNQYITLFREEDQPTVREAINAAMLHGLPSDLECGLLTTRGVSVVRAILRPVIENGTVKLVRGSIQDISDRKLLEDQLRQSQKMEAIGRLAGGIAHDFNNLLTVIHGYCELLEMSSTLHGEEETSLAAIQQAAVRASELTQQLLAFSRKAMIMPQKVDLNQVVLQSEVLLRRLIYENIALQLSLDEGPCFIEADPTQINQVLLNLGINARDAMQDGGCLTISTRRLTLSGIESHGSGGFRGGDVIELTVSDTGAGMSEEVRSRIFEPFFTQKEINKGTGLGLAVVHGIVSQAKGQILVESVVDQGTTFRIHFAAVDSVDVPLQEERSDIVSGTEMILLVEDEEDVRRLLDRALTSAGYQVMSAPSGAAALELVDSASKAFDLLLTDLVMPEIGGYRLAEMLRERNGNFPVLFMSGYAEEAFGKKVVYGENESFIHKPFQPHEVTRKIRSMLDRFQSQLDEASP